jgi:hypothetical protein
MEVSVKTETSQTSLQGTASFSSLPLDHIFNMASTKDVEMTEKKTPDDPHARIGRSNSRSDEAMSKRANKGGGFGTDRYVYFF